MKQNLFFACCAATMLAACSTNEMPENTVTNSDPIRATAYALSMDAATQPGTRAAYTAADAKSMKAFVLASQTEDNYTTTYAKGTMTFHATDAASNAVEYETTGFTGNKQLPADKSSLFLCALYPSVASEWTSIGTTASYTFTGTQDVMAAGQKKIAKGGTGDGTTTAAGAAAFDFKHLLTKLDIKVKAASTEAIAAWGVVQSITVSKVLDAASFNNIVAVTLADGTAAAAAFTGEVTSWPTYTAYSGATADDVFTGKSLALTTSAADAATTMLAPFTATNAVTDLELTVMTKTTTGASYPSTIGVKIPVGPTQGNAYTVTLNFKTTAITGTATVKGWTAIQETGETEVN